ncbi:MAG: D-serine ammonia-lyase [Pseudomonadota bacterium]
MADPTALLRSATPQLWLNPHRAVPGAAPASVDGIALGRADMQGAQDRFTRFAPLLAELFRELAAHQGQIESALTPVPRMQQALGLPPEHGRLWLKADHSLPVAGSIKARGGFHEVLEWAEKLAVQHGLLAPGSDYRCLSDPAARALFAKHQVAVGSTGNLGMAIGVMAAALGFKASVHMSMDAKEWKKERLRNHGVEVVEHTGDYEQAVAQGRQLAAADPLCHFVDDERSLSLFVGYSAAALHLRDQLHAQGVVVDPEHPLLVYIPCGVGGAPSGIAWGLHQLYGAHVYCFFAEPVQSPCFLVQMLAEPGSHPSVYDFGLTNQTQADGLAIPRASLLAAQAMHSVLAGVFTVQDQTLFEHLALLHATEGMRIEPSAAAGFSGPLQLRGHALACAGANHVVWTTGGLLVPEVQYQGFLQQGNISKP